MFATPAYAQAAGGTEGFIANFGFIFILIAIMYFLIIRPQQRKVKEHQSMVDNLRRGDQIVTSGGVVGKVTKVLEEGRIEVEIADGVKVKVISGTVSQVLSKTEPASGG